MIRTIIADDHILVRQGLKAILAEQDDIDVIAEANNGDMAFELTQTLVPDILILDISMPGMNGVETVKKITSAGLKTKVMALSMFADISVVNRMIKNGAKGYVLKTSTSNDILKAIHTLSQGKYFICEELASMIDIHEILHPFEESRVGDNLSPREREVCQLVVTGKTNYAISKNLKISIKTVEKHRASLMKKLGVEDMASLIRIAIQLGMMVVER